MPKAWTQLPHWRSNSSRTCPFLSDSGGVDSVPGQVSLRNLLEFKGGCGKEKDAGWVGKLRETFHLQWHSDWLNAVSFHLELDLLLTKCILSALKVHQQSRDIQDPGDPAD